MWNVISSSASIYKAKLDPEGIGGYCRMDESISNPTWDQVKVLFEGVDGYCCTEMDMEGPKRYYMTIGGGPDRFAVTVIGDDMGPCELLGPDSSDETSSIMLGGVKSDLPRRFIALRDQVIQAAQYFYHHGKLDPALNWHLD